METESCYEYVAGHKVEDYVNTDDRLMRNSESPSENNFIKCEPDIIDDEEHEEHADMQSKESNPLKVTSIEALSALKTLSNFFETNIVDESFYYHYSSLKNIVDDFHCNEKNNC